MQLATDASDLGYGGFWAGRWFSQPWPPGLRLNPIAWREMYAVLVACTTWGHAWQRKRLRQLHGRCGLAEGVNPMPSPHDPRQSPLLHSRRSLFPFSHHTYTWHSQPVSRPSLSSLPPGLPSSSPQTCPSQLTTHDKRMLWAAFCTALYGFLRASEFCTPSASTYSTTTCLCHADL